MLDNYRNRFGVTRVVVIFGIIYCIFQVIIGAIIHDLNPLLFVKAQTTFSKAVYLELLHGWQNAGLMPSYFHHFYLDFFHPFFYAVFLSALMAKAFNINTVSSRYNWLLQKTNKAFPDLDSIESYLDGLLDSFENALSLHRAASARDVQFPEMMGSGPARSKDFACGNGLGPFLVTPDEIPDPLSIDVKVEIGDRYVWRGQTSEYTKRPEQVIDFCESIFPLFPGTVLGFGTIPGCTGMDNDLWIQPGEMIKMTFDILGTLHQKIPDTLPRLEKSRWEERPELKKFMHD